jgi:hypothetical protein
MQLQGIRRLNLTANTLLVTGLVTLFLGIVLGVVFESETLFRILFAFGWIAIGACFLLSFAVSRVRCPNCGRPFNRPDHRNWLMRIVTRTQTHRACVHCNYGLALQSNGDDTKARRSE